MGDDIHERFADTVLPHLDAAYNLARWLTRNDHDAEDVAQEALLRALKFFGGLRGDNVRAWLLSIVRNTGCTWLTKNRSQELIDASTLEPPMAGIATDISPDAMAIRHADQQRVRAAIEALPAEYREVIVLREIEGLSYKEIATITDVALGTVMSRLSRARRRLEECLRPAMQKESERAL